MKTIECYKTSDGLLFENDREASSHQQDIIGEMLDGLLPYDDRGNITQADRYNILTKIMDDKELINKIAQLHYALSFDKED